MTREAGVYAIVNTRNGHGYIGSSVNIARRWVGHRSVLNRGRGVNPHLQAAWNKYGEAAFEFRILDVLHPPFTKDGLRTLEQFHVDCWRPAYNVCRECVSSALGVKFGPMSLEHRANLSEALKGRKLSPEHVAHSAAARKGKPLSPEHVAKVAAALTGRRLSAEHRAKISVAQRGRKHSAEHVAKVAAAHKGRTLPPRSPEYRAKQSATHKGRTLSPEHCASVAAGHRTPEYRKRASEAHKGKRHSPETRAKLSEAVRRAWRDPACRKRLSEAMRRAWAKRKGGRVEWRTRDLFEAAEAVEKRGMT